MTVHPLRPEERLALGLIVAEGDGGLLIDGRELPLSIAVRLSTFGLTALTQEHHQRAIATREGRAAARAQTFDAF